MESNQLMIISPRRQTNSEDLTFKLSERQFNVYDWLDSTDLAVFLRLHAEIDWDKQQNAAKRSALITH